MDHFLFSFVKDLSSYLRDTKDFLRKIEGVVWMDNYLLSTLDITSLYTSIVHTQGIEAYRYFLSEKSVVFYEHNHMILELLGLCLENNIFMFGDQIFRQKREQRWAPASPPAMRTFLLAGGRSRWPGQVVMRNGWTI